MQWLYRLTQSTYCVVLRNINWWHLSLLRHSYPQNLTAFQTPSSLTTSLWSCVFCFLQPVSPHLHRFWTRFLSRMHLSVRGSLAIPLLLMTHVLRLDRQSFSSVALVWPILTNLYLHWRGSIWKALSSTTPLPERVSVRTRKALHKETVSKLLFYWTTHTHLLLVSRPITRCGSHMVFYLGTTARWFLNQIRQDHHPLSLALVELQLMLSRLQRTLTNAVLKLQLKLQRLVEKRKLGWRRKRMMKEHVDAVVDVDVSNLVLFVLWVWLDMIW